MSVLPKTQAGQAVWHTDRDGLSLRLPSATIFIKATTEAGQPEYTIWVATADGHEVGRIVVPPRDAHYDFFREFHRAATEAGWDVLSREIEKSLLQEGTVGTTSAATTLPPELPSGPTSEQAEEFFTRVAGEWHVDFSRGEEDVRIDQNGNVFLLGTMHGKSISPSVRPVFRLEVLACNPTLDQVEIAKVKLNGRTKQIEVLHVTKDEMTGYAKHDGHKLKYTRR
jgi:hypothetical protein